MLRKILVPLDISNTAEIVLPYVAEIAIKTNSSIILTSVLESGHKNMKELCPKYLENLIDKLRSTATQYGSKNLSIMTEILSGNPANEIVDFAEASNVDLIVLSSHGDSGYGPWPLGSVTSKVITTTDRPVLIIRKPAEKHAIAQKHLIGRILVPLDGSELGEAAVSLVQTLGTSLNSEITLFHSVRFMEYNSSEPRSSAQEQKQWEAPWMAYLDSVANSFNQKGLKVNKVIIKGIPADNIVHYAGTNDIDLIAMSSHGSSGIMRWIFGSVTEKVIHAGDTPVLVVRRSKTWSAPKKDTTSYVRV